MTARARVIVLAGPSGSGKSRLAGRLAKAYGWPTLHLDDFYHDGDRPELPLISEGANAGLVDWDHPGTWSHEDAFVALQELCTTGRTEVPAYSISESRRTGSKRLDLAGARRFCAEGIFATEIVEECRRAGILAEAYCITQHPVLTFWRRLTRDLREHRKPPLVLVRRGLALARAQRQIVRRATAVGCRVATGERAFVELSGLRGDQEDDHAVAG
ncbi:ATP-binding protein [Nocardioides daeguensis]|uniref:Uridine kinase n=1 Tax=Nocardioides daeguensis TaxID=908359 RepID=A0ABP6W6T3_9ACTN|nr:ATP-binding protein [Nocardioides daeguensis]MBV6727842.1 ATP-binding protein [Nocardioides daeguensis]MCR1775313.1 ATP-binding protein [Nocardioides daeguensis]